MQLYQCLISIKFEFLFKVNDFDDGTSATLSVVPSTKSQYRSSRGEVI